MIRLCTMPKAQLDPEDPAKGLTDPEGPAEIQPDPEDPVPATKQSHGGSCKIAVGSLLFVLAAIILIVLRVFRLAMFKRNIDKNT